MSNIISCEQNPKSYKTVSFHVSSLISSAIAFKLDQLTPATGSCLLFPKTVRHTPPKWNFYWVLPVTGKNTYLAHSLTSITSVYKRCHSITNLNHIIQCCNPLSLPHQQILVILITSFISHVFYHLQFTFSYLVIMLLIPYLIFIKCKLIGSWEFYLFFHLHFQSIKTKTKDIEGTTFLMTEFKQHN